MDFTPYTIDNNYWILNIEMLEVCQEKTSLFNIMFTRSVNYDKRPHGMEINDAFRGRLPVSIMGKRENKVFHFRKIFDFYYPQFGPEMICSDVWSTSDDSYRIFNVGIFFNTVDHDLLKEEIVKRYDAAYPRIKLS